MAAEAVEIHIDQKLVSLNPGLKTGQELMTLGAVHPPTQLVLEVDGDVDIVLAPTDKIAVRGRERFSTTDGSPQLPDLPKMRHPIPAGLNEGLVTQHHGGGVHGKASVAELVAWAGGGQQTVWLDLDGLADEVLQPADRVILQAADRFITVPREEEDRLYEVTVLLDGEDRVRRFPAGMTVQQAIRHSLPPRDRSNAADFEMVDGAVGTEALNAQDTLKVAGVRDGHLLSITKKNGGGG